MRMDSGKTDSARTRNMLWAGIALILGLKNDGDLSPKCSTWNIWGRGSAENPLEGR